MDRRTSHAAGRRAALVTALALALATVLGLAPGAGAAATWLAPSGLSPVSPAVDSVAAGADAQGDVVAGWIRATAPADPSRAVEVSSRSAGGAFATQLLQTAPSGASSVSTAVNRSGQAVVAWVRTTATSWEVWASTRSAGGSFSPPQALQAVPGQYTYEPATAINNNGDVMVVWRLHNSGANNDTVYGAYRPAGGGFDTAAISSTDTWNQNPRVVLDGSGRATVVWSYWDGSATNIARVRVRQAGGALGTQRDLSETAPTGYPMFATLGVDRSGNVVAVWSHWNGAVYDVKGATRAAASDSWSALAKFGESASASFGSEPQVAVDLDGNAVAIWRAADGTISAASRAAGGGFGSAQTGISAASASGPRVVTGPAGTAVPRGSAPMGPTPGSRRRRGRSADPSAR